MEHVTTVVTGLSEVAQDYFDLELRWPDSASCPLPGQFLTCRAGSGTVPLLRRPFAFSAYSPPHAHFIFERRGPATELLAGKRVGSEIDIIGPLGNSFPWPHDGARPVLLAGGIGVGPLLFFAAELSKRNLRPLLVIGSRTVAKLPELSGAPGIDEIHCTDDGSDGFQGTPVDYLVSLPREQMACAELYLCGPHGLLLGGRNFALEHGIEAWVSVEQTMGCAVGACMGCAIRVHGAETYARVCTEGPVFPAEKILWT